MISILWATCVLHWKIQLEAKNKIIANLKNFSFYRLISATRNYEAEIVSNPKKKY